MISGGDCGNVDFKLGELGNIVTDRKCGLKRDDTWCSDKDYLPTVEKAATFAGTIAADESCYSEVMGVLNDAEHKLAQSLFFMDQRQVLGRAKTILLQARISELERKSKEQTQQCEAKVKAAVEALENKLRAEVQAAAALKTTSKGKGAAKPKAVPAEAPAVHAVPPPAVEAAVEEEEEAAEAAPPPAEEVAPAEEPKKRGRLPTVIPTMPKPGETKKEPEEGTKKGFEFK